MIGEALPSVDHHLAVHSYAVSAVRLTPHRTLVTDVAVTTPESHDGVEEAAGRTTILYFDIVTPLPGCVYFEWGKNENLGARVLMRRSSGAWGAGSHSTSKREGAGSEAVEAIARTAADNILLLFHYPIFF